MIRMKSRNMRQPNNEHFTYGHRCDSLGARAKAAVICAAVIFALLGTVLGPASAATEVRGQPDQMQLRVENASIKEVLDALSATFKLTYKLPPSIGREVSGLYSGTLHQVLARILDGNDYIVKVLDNGIEVVVLGTSGATTIATSGHAVAKSESAVAPSVAASKPTPPASKPIVPASGPTLPASSPPPPLASYLSSN
jgi:hypothetical protein